MMNIYFEDEEIKKNDLLFMCYMIERVARRIHQKNNYVINTIGYDKLCHLISVANTLHSENPKQVEEDWISDYNLIEGTIMLEDVDPELSSHVPTALDMGKVYCRLIITTASPDENYISGIIRVYNDEICEKLDDYNNGAFYEPSYVIARAYKDGEF